MKVAFLTTTSVSFTSSVLTRVWWPTSTHTQSVQVNASLQLFKLVNGDDEDGEAEARQEGDSYLVVEQDYRNAKLERKAPESVEARAEVYYPVCISRYEVDNLAGSKFI